MDKSRPEGYKRYLESESEESIPSRSWFRYKRLNKEETVAASCTNEENNIEMCHEAQDDDMNAKIENMDLDVYDHFMAVHAKENNPSEEFETLSMKESSFESSNPRIHSVVESLVNDIDPIENYRRECAQNSEEDDDFFYDSMDDNEVLMNKIADETENVESPVKNVYKSLDDMVNSKNFNDPIKKTVNRSVGEIIIMIIKYSLLHALCLSEIYDLFNLINCIFDEHILPSSKYLIDKLFWPKNCVNLHAMCTHCGAYVGEFQRKDKFLHCSVCNAEINVEDSAYKDFFVMFNISEPISKLLESNIEYYKYVVNDRIHVKNQIQDIYDGKRYRDFVRQLSANDKKRYATLTFNTDGAPLFESSKCSIWPIFLMINELPTAVRTKDLILAGLWFGKDKPHMNAFLRPFVDTMETLSAKGVPCTIDDSQVLIKIFALICRVDSVARGPVQGFTQFNGFYGCNQCLHPGETVLNNKSNPCSGTIKYPLLEVAPKEGNAEDTIKHMEKAASGIKPFLGVKSPSQLINLMFFNIIFGCVPDSMHCVTGVAKQFATMWLGNKKKSGLFSKKKILEIDTILKNIKVPHQIVKLTRLLSEKEFWKAREWENWIFFYSLPILLIILPPNLLVHWALFVEAIYIYILQKENIQGWEVDRADRLLHHFVADTEALYSKAAMTFNVHLLLHLARSVYDWGPLWSHNAFPFESGNGDLVKHIHAAKGIHSQVCRHISLKYSMLILKQRVHPCSSVQQFLLKTGTTMVEKTFKITENRYFGLNSNVSQFWIEKFQISCTKTMSYKKLIKNRCLYMSSLKSNRRSDNTFAQLLDGTYVQLNYFLVDSDTKKEYAIVHYVHTISFFEETCNMMRKIIQIDEQESAVLTENISKICVHFSVHDKKYLCTVPNLRYY